MVDAVIMREAAEVKRGHRSIVAFLGRDSQKTSGLRPDGPINNRSAGCQPAPQKRAESREHFGSAGQHVSGISEIRRLSVHKPPRSGKIVDSLIPMSSNSMRIFLRALRATTIFMILQSRLRMARILERSGFRLAWVFGARSDGRGDFTGSGSGSGEDEAHQFSNEG